MVDQAPQASAYFSDGCATYAQVVSGEAVYASLPDKSETYTVEGGNADLRHSLARSVRKSCCFSRSIDALRRALKLLIWTYNRRRISLPHPFVGVLKRISLAACYGVLSLCSGVTVAICPSTSSS